MELKKNPLASFKVANTREMQTFTYIHSVLELHMPFGACTF